jgi:hypothetical protein
MASIFEGVDMLDLPQPPGLEPMARVRCDVGPIVTLGAAPLGERRCVSLLGGTVEGTQLAGRIEPGGVDWQIARTDGVLEIDAHYVVRTADDALIEVRSQGLRHASPEVMVRLMRGEPVARHEYFFRTLMRFATGAPAWAHLNRVMALAVGERQAKQVVLDVYRIE